MAPTPASEANGGGLLLNPHDFGWPPVTRVACEKYARHLGNSRLRPFVAGKICPLG